MARRHRGIRAGQKTVTGADAKAEPTLYRGRMMVPDEEYDELDEVATNRIWNHLRKEHWEDLKDIKDENLFFTSLTRISARPKDAPLQNLSRKASDALFSKFVSDIGWVEAWKLPDDRRDYYRSLIKDNKLDELNRIHKIKIYWQQVKVQSGRKHISIARSRTMWAAKKKQQDFWAKK
jgi:hypothetical protein